MTEVREIFSEDAPVTTFGLVIVLGLPGQSEILLWCHDGNLFCFAELVLRSSQMCELDVELDSCPDSCLQVLKPDSVPRLFRRSTGNGGRLLGLN